MPRRATSIRSVLVGARLAPDMLPFVKQIQLTSDFAKNSMARLAGVDPPKFEDNETHHGRAGRAREEDARVHRHRPGRGARRQRDPRHQDPAARPHARDEGSAVPAELGDARIFSSTTSPPTTCCGTTAWTSASGTSSAAEPMKKRAGLAAGPPIDRHLVDQRVLQEPSSLPAGSATAPWPSAPRALMACAGTASRVRDGDQTAAGRRWCSHRRSPCCRATYDVLRQSISSGRPTCRLPGRADSGTRCSGCRSRDGPAPRTSVNPGWLVSSASVAFTLPTVSCEPSSMRNVWPGRDHRTLSFRLVTLIVTFSPRCAGSRPRPIR